MLALVVMGSSAVLVAIFIAGLAEGAFLFSVWLSRLLCLPSTLLLRRRHTKYWTGLLRSALEVHAVFYVVPSSNHRRCTTRGSKIITFTS